MADTFYMRRKGGRLEPCSLMDEEALNEFPEGKDLSVTVKRSRSLKQHRFFWGLLNKVTDNHEAYHKPEQLLLWLKIRLGYVDEVKFHNEEIWWVAKSISFNAMGQDEFRKFFDSSLDLICGEIIPNMDKSALIYEVEEMLGFKLEEVWNNGV